MNSPRIALFLDTIRNEGRSSPLGPEWHRFFKFLTSKKQSGHRGPPVPLILAADGASNASKHRRLADQLEWASENGCINEAINYLEHVSGEKWNTGTAEHWNKDYCPD